MLNLEHPKTDLGADKNSPNPNKKIPVRTSAILGIPALRVGNKKHRRNENKKNTHQVWKVLLDTGSDGDILFLKDNSFSSRISTKRKLSPQRWKTTSGAFKCTKTAHLKMEFPEFSTSKLVDISPDVFEIGPNEKKPTYDLILGTETLSALGCILDFSTRTIQVDGITLPMNDVGHVLKHKSALDTNSVYSMYKNTEEPVSTHEETKRAVKILDAKYEKADLPTVVEDNCSHLTDSERSSLLVLLQKYEELFDGTLGEWDTDPVHLELKKDSTPFRGRPFPVPQIHEATLKREVERLCSLGVIEKQRDSEWGSPTFILPKKEGTVRFLTDFREVNKKLIRKSYPIPKISDIMQKLLGFTYATALDLNMGYYTIRLDADSQKICTIILPWGKYSYKRLPMGICCSPDIFQEKMSSLMEDLQYVRTYIDDLLVLTRSSFTDHLEKLEPVLEKLQKAGLRVNLTKTTLCAEEIEYLGYMLTRDGIKPMPNKVDAILNLARPTNVKQLRRVLGIVQYYRDIWEKRSHVLAPLTDLVGECGHTKVTKKNKKKKKAFYWNDTHESAFLYLKKLVAREITLAYPDFNEEFVIYTDASDRQLGAVITQNNRPIAMFSRKLNTAQRKYTTTERELLSIVETLREFKSILWGQRIKVYTDHKNLIHAACGMSSDRVQRWRLLLEEYGPEILYIKGEHNTVADALSRLDMIASSKKGSKAKPKQVNMTFANLLSRADLENKSESKFNSVFVVEQEDGEIRPPTIATIAQEQENDRSLRQAVRIPNSGFSKLVVDDIEIVVKDSNRIVIPVSLQRDILDWYHHYLIHPGKHRMTETLTCVFYWKGMHKDVENYVRKCPNCQKGKKSHKKYGKLPEKVVITVPWQVLCTDCIGPYSVKDVHGQIYQFMCVTMIDPATSWFEMREIPVLTVTNPKTNEEKIVFEKTSSRISQIINSSWLSRYPRPKNVVYDNGSEFKLYFKALCDSYGLVRKPTTIKNPQANAINERIHQVIGNMLRTSGIEGSDLDENNPFENFLTNAAWAIRSTHHSTLGCSPGAAIFGRDMMFNLPHAADWSKIGKTRQKLAKRDNIRENTRRIDKDYQVGQKVLIRNDEIIRKSQNVKVGPFVITQIHTNGTVRIQRGKITERLNIRRLVPYFE